jgi:NitT/TauT family transport system substrate-binding protein
MLPPRPEMGFIMALAKALDPMRHQAATMAATVLLFVAMDAHAGAEHIKIACSQIAQSGPTFIAKEKGYFAAEGLDAELVFFDAAEPMAVAAASGGVDFAIAGTSAGLYSLAGRGALRIIAGGGNEAPGYQNLTFVVSNRAADAGFKTYADLPGHSVGVPQIGSPSHYSLALIAEKNGIDLKTIRVLPLQSVANVISAVIGNQADAGVIPATAVRPAIERKDLHLLGFVGDEAPYQTRAAFTSTRNADERHATVEAFLRAFRHGARDYHAAFIGPDGKRRDGPEAPEILAILAKYTGQSVAQVKLSIAYVDEGARLDVTDVLHQIAWYKAQGMLKGDVDGEAAIDRRYVVPMPER